MNTSKTLYETSPKQKRRFFLFLSSYLLGYFLLLFIGNSINVTGFTVLSFLSPAATLIGVIGITWSLCHKS